MKWVGAALLLTMVSVASATAAQQAPVVEAPPGVVMEPPAVGAEVSLPSGRVYVEGRLLRLHLQSEPLKLTFYLRTGQTHATTTGVSFGMEYGYGGGYGPRYYPGYYGYGFAPYSAHTRADFYQQLCTSPCDLTLVEGTHRFSVSYAERDPLDLGPIELRTPSVLQVRYIDRRKLRIAGWAVFLVSTALGIGLTVGGLEYNAFGDTIRNKPMFWSGTAIWIAGTIGGLALIFQGDKARVSLEPLPSY